MTPASSQPDTPPPDDAAPAPDLGGDAYEELRRLARYYLGGERAGHTLQPTALVHEAFLKLASGSRKDWRSETHFQAVAASAMRQILVDHARQRATRKRGGDRVRVTLAPDVGSAGEPDLDVLALDEAMRELAALDDRKSRVVELRFFGGMTCSEAAETLGISPKTVEADWSFARAWLHSRIG